MHVLGGGLTDYLHSTAECRGYIMVYSPHYRTGGRIRLYRLLETSSSFKELIRQANEQTVPPSLTRAVKLKAPGEISQMMKDLRQIERSVLQKPHIPTTLEIEECCEFCARTSVPTKSLC